MLSEMELLFVPSSNVFQSLHSFKLGNTITIPNQGQEFTVGQEIQLYGIGDVGNGGDCYIGIVKKVDKSSHKVRIMPTRIRR